MFVVTGASGRTGRAAAAHLLAHGHPVRAVGRSARRLADLAERGAEVWEAEQTDAAALADAFHGAEGVYAVIQPNYIPDHPDFAAFQDAVAASLTRAITVSGVTRVVGLSSWGAQHAEGTGPVAGLHRFEQLLSATPGVDILWLRAGYFMENLLDHADAAREHRRISGPLAPDLPLPFVTTRDIGTRAAEELVTGAFSGTEVLELQGERDVSMREATEVIANAVGADDLVYEQLDLETFRAELRRNGVSLNVERMMAEVGTSLNSQHTRMRQPRTARTSTPTSIENFVEEEFAPRYADVHPLPAA
ncbi:NAD(P)H-binding protein [Streptomyces sp. Rer75]|uniref:NmrA family NAD(P)-binding protein n=1 Tax=unclassified Streptomyces TaxID=2593676 RepID=UPI0015CFBAF7|nr:NAD(P)H-binding protein [Streptomyces sp. Rer75]QLH21030.1 NAD(P)H-binding protein [Streptomyces sp. Rer75]